MSWCKICKVNNKRMNNTAVKNKKKIKIKHKLKKKILKSLHLNKAKRPKNSLSLKRNSVSNSKVKSLFLIKVPKKHQKKNPVINNPNPKSQFLLLKRFKNLNKMNNFDTKKSLKNNLNNKLSKTTPYRLWYIFYYISKNLKRWPFINRSTFSWKNTFLVLIKLIITDRDNNKPKLIIR